MSSTVKEKFWVDNFPDLFKFFTLVPSTDGTEVEILNIATRILFIVALIMFAMDNRHYSTVLWVGIIVILLLYLLVEEDTANVSFTTDNNNAEEMIENYICNNHLEISIKGNTTKPKYYQY